MSSFHAPCRRCFCAISRQETKDAVKWRQASPIGKLVEELVVQECKPSEFADCDVIFSGLDVDVAGGIGM
jgi:aspartate-semialdehyde dehydrogenase